MKFCKTCGENKPLNQYRVDKSCSDGLRSSCSPCLAAASRDYYSKNKDAARATMATRRKNKREERAAARLLWQQQHADEIASRKTAREEHRKAQQKIRTKRHYEANTADYIARARERMQDVSNRTMQWADKNIIQFLYATRNYMTKATKQNWHVDHVVPLKGKLVSGLHTHHNLRVIPATDNFRKSNKFEVAA